MKKIVIAVDDTKGSKAATVAYDQLFACSGPEEVVLVYVERFAGESFLDDMITDAELKTLNEVLKGTEFKDALDRKATSIMDFYKKSLENKGLKQIKSVIRTGHPAEEILKTAHDENADMIFIGSRGRRTHSFVLGSVSREVVNESEIPVFVAKVK